MADEERKQMPMTMRDFDAVRKEMTRLELLLADEGGQLTAWWFTAVSTQFDRVRAEMDALCPSERTQAPVMGNAGNAGNA